MRVLHLFKTYYPESMGGIEQVIFQLCQSCRAHGIEGEVLTLSANPLPERVQVGSHWVQRARLDLNLASTGFSRDALAQFRLRARHADLIHYHFPWPFMDLLHFAAGLRKPTLLTYHSDIVRQKMLLRLYRPLMHRFLSSVDAIVTASPNYLETSRVLALYRDKTQVVPYGLDRQSYPAASPDVLEGWRTRFPAGFFLFVGVMRYYKGLHILLEACQNSHYPVLIVGAGPLESALREQAQRLRLSNVHFLGALPDADKIALLQLSRALVFPSHLRSEAFGISLLEGAMFGKPMISSEIGTGTSYINNHGETGLVVPPGDAAALRQAMDRLWVDADMAARMGAAAQQRYEQLFTAARMGQRMAEVYQQVMARQPRRNSA
ncbi:glycosyltransferase family 4 protein [Pseudomonas fluvialis]|uniref:glycosyltransferase family 4 protein n=1 Tax=Pseudomonas fluvialis TaxID=1793966 RepID=UPI00370BC8E7